MKLLGVAGNYCSALNKSVILFSYLRTDRCCSRRRSAAFLKLIGFAGKFGHVIRPSFCQFPFPRFSSSHSSLIEQFIVLFSTERNIRYGKEQTSLQSRSVSLISFVQNTEYSQDNNSWRCLFNFEEKKQNFFKVILFKVSFRFWCLWKKKYRYLYFNNFFKEDAINCLTCVQRTLGKRKSTRSFYEVMAFTRHLSHQVNFITSSSRTAFGLADKLELISDGKLHELLEHGIRKSLLCHHVHRRSLESLFVLARRMRRCALLTRLIAVFQTHISANENIQISPNFTN